MNRTYVAHSETHFEQIPVEAVRHIVAGQRSRKECLHAPGRGIDDAATVARQAATTARVLLVDADDDARSLYREWFQSSGFDIVEAIDGREALAKALIRRPAIIVTEIRLPFVDGHALCEILRRDHVTVDVPILVITAESRPAELRRVVAAGASAVLVKPTTAEEMWVEVRRLLVDGTAGRERVTATRPEPESSRSRQPVRAPLSKSLARVATTAPPLAPPPAVCPRCDRRLSYRHSHLGGVSERRPEQWDVYVCLGSCGRFEYRHRTRSLRPLVEDDALR